MLIYTIIFIILKLLGFIGGSWWWILLPLFLDLGSIWQKSVSRHKELNILERIE